VIPACIPKEHLHGVDHMGLHASSCLIVGAGLSGLVAARTLKTAGLHVTVLDKSRGVGGRLATRRLGNGRFDHGAQFFTVRDPRFQQAVDDWIAHGVVHPWYTEGGHTRYRAENGMNSLAKDLAAGLSDIRLDAPVQRLELANAGWRAVMADGSTVDASMLLVTAPAPQTLVLAGSALPDELTGQLRQITFDPCFALLVELDGPSRVPAPGYTRPDAGPIAWIADNVQKGISPAPQAALTIHARPDFTRDHLEDDLATVQQSLIEAAEPYFGESHVLNAQLHRWRYSQPVHTTAEPCLFSAASVPVAIAGDAFGGPRVEGAYLSGLAAAEVLRQHAR